MWNFTAGKSARQSHSVGGSVGEGRFHYSGALELRWLGCHPDDFSNTQIQDLEDFYADYPAVTRHPFGKGSGYYLGASLEAWLLSRVIDDAGVQDRQNLPTGVEN